MITRSMTTTATLKERIAELETENARLRETTTESLPIYWIKNCSGYPNAFYVETTRKFYWVESRWDEKETFAYDERIGGFIDFKTGVVYKIQPYSWNKYTNEIIGHITNGKFLARA